MLHSVTKLGLNEIWAAALLPGFFGVFRTTKFAAKSLLSGQKKRLKWPDSGLLSILRMADITRLFHVFRGELRFIFWFCGNFSYQTRYSVYILQRFDKRLQTERIFFPCGKAKSRRSA